MGDICVFSAGPSFRGDANDLYGELPNGDLVGKNYNTQSYDGQNPDGSPIGNGRTPVTGPLSYTYEKTVTTGFDNGVPQTKQEEVQVNIEGPWTNYSQNGWRTSGSAGSQDGDLIEIEFSPGKKTTYTITPGASNDNGAQAGDDTVAQNLWDGTQWLAPVAGDGISDYNQYDLTTGKYVTAPGTNGSNSTHQTGPRSQQTGVIITNDLPDGFDRTEMTLQVESSSIGIIYAEYDTSGAPDENASGVGFTPTPYYREVPKDRHGNDILLAPKGFDRFDETDFASAANAKNAADKMRGNSGYFGEMKCIVENRIGSLGAEYKRVDSEIRALENQITNGELALGRIQDADMAREATELARNNLKSDMATQVMSNSGRLKDVLIQLTTEHFRGAALSASL